MQNNIEKQLKVQIATHYPKGKTIIAVGETYGKQE